MLQLIRAAIVLALLLFLFYLWGFIYKWFKRDKRQPVVEAVIWGAFLYFSIFQLVALPAVVLRGSVTGLAIIWTVLVLGITGIAVYLGKKAIIDDARCMIQMFCPSNFRENWLLYLTGILVAAAVIFSILQPYNGWDTAYYLGGMNTSLYTDTFYQYEDHTGIYFGTDHSLNMHYALSCFYVHFTVLCRLFCIDVRVMAFYTIRALCMILAAAIVYMIGHLVYGAERKKSACLVIGWLILNFFWLSGYATPFFLLIRGYEAKGYCANVIIPALLFCILALIKNPRENGRWKDLFLVCLGSVPMSMSSLVIVPVAIAIMGIVMMLTYRSLRWLWKIFIRCLLCAMPNLVYLLVYVLWILGVRVL